MTEPIRIVVADDHPMFLDGLVATLSGDDELKVVAAVVDGPAAVQAVKLHRPDLALLDVAMPGGGLEALRQVAAASPSTRSVILTSSEAEDDLMAAMKAGARGYVLKGISGRELRTILKTIHSGGTYLAPGLAYGALRELSRPRPRSPIDDLTNREREVLDLVASGLSNAEIGGQLGLAEKTVKHYMTSVLGKLGVASRVEAALLAYKAGMGSGRPEGPEE
jgi:two-component system nitrate/nitrite response regulator NarL